VTIYDKSRMIKKSRSFGIAGSRHVVRHVCRFTASARRPGGDARRSSRCAGTGRRRTVYSVSRVVGCSLGGCCLDGRLAGVHLDLAGLGLLGYRNPQCQNAVGVVGLDAV